jgi:rubrerythrin
MQPVDVLKMAILLEKRGQAFYRKVAQQSTNQAVQTFFDSMATEETEHVRILSEQLRAVRQQGAFQPLADAGQHGAAAEIVMSPELMQRLAAADFETAAISAAMAMEEKAIKLYRDRAETATDPEEKALFKWLAEWESGHLRVLSDLDRKVTETIWNDNQYWPF